MNPATHLMLAAALALPALGACHHVDPQPAAERSLLAALDSGLDLDVAGEPATGLHLKLDLGSLKELAIASRTSLAQSMGAGSDPTTADGATSSRAEGAVVMTRDAAEEDGSVVMRLSHPALSIDPDLGSSAMRLAGLAAKGAVRLHRTRSGTLSAEVLTAADAVAPVVSGWMTGLALAYPTLPAGAVAAGDSWTDRVDLPFGDDQFHLVAERSFTLRGTAPCRRAAGRCAVITGELRLSQSGKATEDDDTMTRLRGNGTGTLHVWVAVDGGTLDGAELRTSISSEIARATTGGPATVVAQKRQSVTLIVPPGGAP